MNNYRWLVTVLVGLLLASGLSAQSRKTIPIGGKIAEGYRASLHLEKIVVGNKFVECHFFFRNMRSPGTHKDELFGLSGAYLDNYDEVAVSGIELGRNYSLKPTAEKRFSIKIDRPANALHLSGINVGSRSYNATIKLSNRSNEKSVIDLSGAIASVPFNKKPIITESAEKEDTQKPVIIVSSPTFTQGIFRTDEFTVTISGTARDNVGIATVAVNGKTASLKSDGRFQKRLKLKFGKNPIVISAIDINDNKVDSRITIIREEIIEDDEFSDVDFAPEYGITTKNGIAVVLGIEEYQYAPSVSYAYNDADIFREYLVKTFGYSRENIYFRTNERATKGELEKIFSANGWLAKNTTRKSDVIIFYAGHGAPDLEAVQSYLIPFDIDPNYATTGYALEDLYQNLGKLKTNSVTLILDACFSGGSRDNQPLLADARPVYISVEEERVLKNTIVFSAASRKEISSAYGNKLHGLFTYFFLKGLNGNADNNQDRRITNEEMQAYLLENVSAQARRMGREQHPQLIGLDKNRILLKY